MSGPVRVRAYVVGFGDCVLLQLPGPKQTRRSVLIDFGRSPGDPESLARFPAIAQDIAKECNGRLDLLVATHEHLDHIEGFYRERAVFDQMHVEQVWMGLPSQPDYYALYPKARPQKRLRDHLADFQRDATRRGLVFHPAFAALLENNLSNADRLTYLRGLGKKPVRYLARSGKAVKPFAGATVRVLSPEPDVSTYYAKGRGRAMLAAAGSTDGDGARTIGSARRGLPSAPRSAPAPLRGARGEHSGMDWTFPNARRATPEQLGGVAPSDFARLRRTLHEDGVQSARFIDRALNNTSLCLLFEVGGKRLLLPGDAELESWDMMANTKGAKEHLLAPVDFLKVSHHGSHNGTPPDLLDTLLPKSRKSEAVVLVSTKKNIYGTKHPVPDASLMEDLRSRCRELCTTEGHTGRHIDMEI